MATYYVYLRGDHWASRSIGYLAVEIIAGLVLIACLFILLFWPVKWAFRGTTDSLRTYIFTVSTIATIVYFIMDLATLGEDEKDAVVSIKYYDLYIIIELFYRISEFTILFVIMRTVNVLAFADFGNSTVHGRVQILTIGLLGIVGVVSLTTFSLLAAYYGSYADADFNVNNLYPAIIGFFVTYDTLYVVASIYTLVVAAIAIVQTRSKVSLIMQMVATCLTLRAVVFLADTVVDYYTHDIRNKINLDWANNFIYNIMIIVIYVGVTAVARIGSGFNQMQKSDPGQELAPFASPHVYE